MSELNVPTRHSSRTRPTNQFEDRFIGLQALRDRTVTTSQTQIRLHEHTKDLQETKPEEKKLDLTPEDLRGYLCY